jgi:hypothetical protein
MATILPGTQLALTQSATPEAAQPAGITVFPPHGTRTASPGTEISFRGIDADGLGTVEAFGAQSGSHYGVLKAHSDGQGVSFIPDAPFFPGEWVTVRAGVPLRPTPRGSVTFQVSVPAVPVMTPITREIDQPQTPPQVFQSRLDLMPPVITVTDRSRAVAPGLVCVGAKIEDGQNGAMLLDNEGDLVWFSPLDITVAAHNDVRVQEYQGQPVLTMWEGIARQGTGFGHLILLDQSYAEVARVQVGNGYPGVDQHETYLTPAGTVLFIIYNPVRWDLTPVGGEVNGWTLDGVVQEIDVATGCVTFEWHALDHIAIEEAFGDPTQNPEEPWDYVHLNSAEPTDDGNLIVSARHTHAIYKIERATGRVLWRLNGKASDFRMGEGSPFAYQHDARVHDNGELTLFDNASSDQDEADTVDSRGLVLQLDEEAKTATVVREFIHPTGTLSVSQGNMQVLPNGNVFVGWGSAPVFSEFGPEGELLFNGRFPEGGTSYRAYRCEWVGTPSEPPAIAVERGLGSEVTLYVSWNGATEVARWQVLAGSAPDQLAAVAEAARSGFETAFTVEVADPLVAVQAIDADGNALGTSEAVLVRE